MAESLINAVQIPDGTWIRGRGLRDPTPIGPVPDFALYLGLSRLRNRHEAKLLWPHEWVPWPDYMLPLDWHETALAIVRLYDRARSGEAVEVACKGGVGRTGTVISCMTILAGLPAHLAVRWTRRKYNPRAVETPWQRRWVAWFATHHPPVP
ncbi:protein-tyrosine phosphatase family protein [Planobispora takensis]|uniref:Protein-tyrosine-phosphatase n=1 Tax=Planobispora takensis TaxID=1367882 RepID=A0A8J3STL7_9ACTN|nr:protein-tyrosine phosphatase family protein [Planobispora takensis]GII00302.1 protein-tyrosine-phosphatase [Planobispora takensis]